MRKQTCLVIDVPEKLPRNTVPLHMQYLETFKTERERNIFSFVIVVVSVNPVDIRSDIKRN